jgi:DNA primase
MAGFVAGGIALRQQEITVNSPAPLNSTLEFTPIHGSLVPSETMARVPEETLQQILASTDIVELIGRSVKLRRAGSNWQGLCPFHNEKSPSFNVRPSTNSYHCFGCGVGGNAFRFVMEHDGLTFMEAVKRLADAANIRIEEQVWDENAEKEAKHRTLLIRVHQEIAVWYHQLLMKSPLAESAREYLKGRGINSAVAKNWKLGYAPSNGQLLRQWATEQKFGKQALIDAGILIYSEERGDAFPRFRDRLMFPICNDNGEVIAFSGRLLEANPKMAKYLNSPETPIFSKSKVLFGFDRAKRHISKAGQAIVCEGQIDTLMLHEAGFTNAVAGQGTAFTEVHAKTLKRQADEIVLCYDSDNAGFKAGERAFQILAPTGLIIKVASLPAGEDPDSLIRKQGPEAFKALLQSAQEFLDYQVDAAASRRDMGEMRERVRFAGEMAGNIHLLESPVARETAIQRAAVRLSIPEDTMRQLVARAAKQPTTRNSRDNTKTPTPGESPGKQLLASQDKNAILLTRLALADAQVLDWLRHQPHDDVLRDVPGTELLALIWRGTFDPVDTVAVTVFLTTLEPDEEAALNQLMHEARATGGMAEAEHELRALELTRLLMMKQRLQTQLKQPGIDPEHAAELQREIIALHQDIGAAQKSFMKPQS